jgi:hypothetical protein
MVTGTLLIQNADYLQPISAVSIETNGQTVYITYLDSDGKLKSATSCTTHNVDGSVPAAMSGCDVVQ